MRSSLFSPLALLMLALNSCTPAASTVPLSNAKPEGLDTYYYGDAPQRQVAPSEAKSASPKPAQLGAKKHKKAQEKKDPKEGSAEALGAKPDGGVAEEDLPLDAVVGVYSGTDKVTLDVPGLPGGEQVDEHANLRVEEGSQDGQLEVTVVDSSDGKDLCRVVATLSGKSLKFESGQECFSAITGGRLKATLKSGTASVQDETIKVKYHVELEYTELGPGTGVAGTLDYSFEGERD